MLKNDLGSLIATLALSLIAFVIMFPLEALISGTHAIGDSTRDLYDHVFLIDHWQTSAINWNYPDGGRIMPPDISGMLLASPWLWLGDVVAFNIALLCQFLLCAAAGWLLGKQFGSGMVGGLSMAISPIILGQFCSGEAETTSAWTIPLFFYFIFKHPKHGNWLGVVAALAGVFSWYYGAYLGIILFLFCLWQSQLWTAHRKWNAFKPLVVCLFCVAPFAIWYGGILNADVELFKGLSMSEYMASHPRALSSFSADPAAWFMGSQFSAAHTDYFGMLPLVFLLFGVPQLLRSDKNSAVIFLCVLFGSAILAVGPVLHIRGNPIFEWMPYRWLLGLPGIDLMRLPHRWMLVVVAASIPFVSRATRSMPILFALMLMCESIWFSSPQRTLTPITVPNIIENYEGPVLDLPPRTLGADARGQYLIWQKSHQQPIPYSLLMSGWSKTIGQEPLVQWVASQDSRDPIAERVVEAGQFRQSDFANAVGTVRSKDITGGTERLKQLDYWGVVLHHHLLDPDDAIRIQRRLEEEFGAPTHETEEAALWVL